jgi:hypothetical protein
MYSETLDHHAIVCVPMGYYDTRCGTLGDSMWMSTKDENVALSTKLWHHKTDFSIFLGKKLPKSDRMAYIQAALDELYKLT